MAIVSIGSFWRGCALWARSAAGIQVRPYIFTERMGSMSSIFNRPFRPGKATRWCATIAAESRYDHLCGTSDSPGNVTRRPSCGMP